MILKNILVQYYPKLISIPISLSIQAMLIRTFSVDNFATLSVILAIITYIIGFSDMGFSNYFYRQSLANKQNYFTLILKTRFILFLFVLIIFFLLSLFDYFEHIYSNIFLVSFILILSLLQIVGDTIEKMIRSVSKFDILAKRGVLYSLILFLLVCSLYFTDFLTLYSFLFISTIVFIIKFYIEYNDLREVNHYSNNTENDISYKIILPWIFIFIFNLIFTRLDLFMLNSLSSNYDVAVYGATYTIYEKLEFFLLSIAMVLYNFFANEKKYEILGKIIFFITIVSIFFILLGTILYTYFINLIVGNKYLNAHELFIVMLIGTYFKFHTAIFVNILLLEKYEKQVAIIVFIVLMTNAILNYYFIPQYGALGASYTTFISDFINILLAIFFISRNRIYRVSKLYIISILSILLLILLPDIYKIIILSVSAILLLLYFFKYKEENLKILGVYS